MVEHEGGNGLGSVGDDGVTEIETGVTDGASGGWSSLEELADGSGVNRRELKKRFPEVPITVVIPDSSSYSCSVSLNEEDLSSLGVDGDVEVRELVKEEVLVPKSGYGDHYIEFGHLDARSSGERSVRGLEIVLK